MIKLHYDKTEGFGVFRVRRKTSVKIRLGTKNMDITKIDKNFEIKKSVNFEFDEYDASKYPFTVYGGFCEPRRKFEKMRLFNLARTLFSSKNHSFIL